MQRICVRIKDYVRDLFDSLYHGLDSFGKLGKRLQYMLIILVVLGFVCTLSLIVFVFGIISGGVVFVVVGIVGVFIGIIICMSRLGLFGPDGFKFEPVTPPPRPMHQQGGCVCQ